LRRRRRRRMTTTTTHDQLFVSFLLSLFYDKNQSSMMSMRFSSVIEIIQLKAYMPISLPLGTTYLLVHFSCYNE
jgi:hypothetical protein